MKPTVAATAFVLLALAGCGSSSSPDAGGFTGSLRASAQKALDGLRYSGVPETISTFNSPDALLSTCTVHVVSEKPLVFRLFMDWKPKELGRTHFPLSQNEAQVRIRYSWLAAIIPTASGSNPTVDFGQIPAAIPIAVANHRLEASQGPAFVQPFEECELLPGNVLRGFAYGNVSTPITTTTVPTATTS